MNLEQDLQADVKAHTCYIKRDRPQTSEKKMWWTLKFLRAVRTGSYRQAVRAAALNADMKKLLASPDYRTWTNSAIRQIEELVQRY